MIGIYKIQNLINGKVYIGQSTDIHARLLDHKRINERPKEYIKQSYPLYSAFKKYGLENFSFEPIEECDIKDLDEREKYWINYYHSYANDKNSNGYNLTRGGLGNLQTTEEEINTMINLWELGYSVGQIVPLVKKDNHCIIKFLKAYCPSYTTKEGDRRGRVMNGLSHRKSIKVYNKFGIFEAEYNSVKDCAEDRKWRESPICAVINNKQSNYKGYYCIDAKEDQNTAILSRMKKSLVQPILEMSSDYKTIINCYGSLTEVEYFTGIKKSSISANCCKRTKSAHQRYWMYLSSYIEENGFDYKWEDKILIKEEHNG